MNVLVIAGRLGAQAWTNGPVVRDLIGHLRRDGARVTLAADTADDPKMFGESGAGAAEVRTFRAHCQSTTWWSLGFPAWAREVQRSTCHDVCVSLSPRVGGEVWWPIEASGGSWVRWAAGTHGTLGLGLALGRHHGVLAAWGLETIRALPSCAGLHAVQRVLAVGGRAAEDARGRVRASRSNAVVVELPAMARASAMDSQTRAGLRARTREVLRIAEHRRVFCVSVTGAMGPSLDALIGAMADLSESGGGGVGAAGLDRADTPVLLVLARDGYRAHEAALRAGRTGCVRIMGLTACPEAALAASDVCVLATPAQAGAFASGSMIRFAGDALAMGRPLLALREAPGAALIAAREHGEEAGLIVPRGGQADWLRGLRTAVSEEWLAGARRGAERAGRELMASSTLDVVAGVVREVGGGQTLRRPE